MTITAYLDNIAPIMAEKGLQRQWNDLKRFALASLSGYTGTVGAIDSVTSLAPDVVNLYPNPWAEKLSEDTPRNGFVRA